VIASDRRRHPSATGDRAAAFVDAHPRGLLAAAAGLAGAVLVVWLVAKLTTLIAPATEITAVHAWIAHHGPLRDLARTIAAIGNPVVAIVAVGALATVRGAVWGVRGALLPVLAATVVIPTTIAKDMPGRLTSLPSGHTAFTAAVGGYAAWLLLRAGHPRRALAMVALALSMAPARVIEGAHKPVDVVTGVVLGVAWLLAVLVLERAWLPRGRSAAGRALS
jgi:membrane-associated phospholipid phosphatase